jgi:hypothetical protein
MAGSPAADIVHFRTDQRLAVLLMASSLPANP